MKLSDLHIILNPASSSGKTGSNRDMILNKLDNHFSGKYSLFITEKPLDATVSARNAIQSGAKLVIAIGGDGTFQEVINGFFHKGKLINPNCELGIINAGTGQGFVQSLGLVKQLEKQIEIIAGGKSKYIDIGRVEYLNINNNLETRYFINECQAGIGGEVVKSIHSRSKKFARQLVFGIHAFLKLFSYHGKSMEVIIDDKITLTNQFIGIMVANGNYQGGMKLLPEAKIDDNLLDILLIYEQSIFQRLLNFPKIYTGGHIHTDKFDYLKCKKIQIGSNDQISVEADGELLGFLPCKIEIIPSALKIRIN